MQSIFQQGDFEEARSFVESEPGRALGVCLTSGHTFQLSGLLTFNGRVLTGIDPEGSQLKIDALAITSYLFLNPEPDEPSHEEINNAAAWQVAFMELRAACDESEDPRVQEAAARLDRIESEQVAEAIHGGGEA